MLTRKPFGIVTFSRRANALAAEDKKGSSCDVISKP
jgi:hypothetical protein